MQGLRRWLIVREIQAAVALGAFGDWWAFCAGRRLRKLSGRQSVAKDTGGYP